MKVKGWLEDERLVWKGDGLLCESDGMVFWGGEWCVKMMEWCVGVGVHGV